MQYMQKYALPTLLMSAVTTADCRTLRSLLVSRRRGRDAKGDSFRECMMAMPCTCLVMNESS